MGRKMVNREGDAAEGETERRKEKERRQEGRLVDRRMANRSPAREPALLDAPLPTTTQVPWEYSDHSHGGDI